MKTLQTLHTEWVELSNQMDNPTLTPEQETDIINQLEIIEMAVGTDIIDQWIDEQYSATH